MATPLFFTCQKEEHIEPEQKKEIYENVKIISENQLEEISKIDSSGTINFETAQNYQVGDILVGGISERTPGGILKKIIDVSEDGKQIETINASLDETIKTGEFSYSKNFNLNDFNETKSVKGLEYDKDGFNFEFNEIILDLDGNFSTEEDQIKLNGKINLGINTNLYFKFDEGNFKFDFEIDLNKNSSFETIANLNFLEFDKEILAFRSSGIPFQIPGAPIPLIARPEFELYLGAKGELDSKIKTNIEDNFEFFGGIYYNNGWTSQNNWENEFIFYEPTASLKGEIQAYCKPKLNMIINEIAGPGMGIKNYLEMDINSNESPWWNLYGGYDVFLGISSGWLTRSFGSYEKNLLEYKEKIADSESLENLIAQLNISPNEGFPPMEVNFDASESKGEIIEYYFDLGNGENYVERKGEENFDGIFNYIYESSGNYQTKLIIKDIFGKTDSKSLEVVVKEPLPPTANFEISPPSGNEETNFTFDASYSSDDEDIFENLFFRWDFEGDGIWESEFNKEFLKEWKYETYGNYSPTLEVKDSRGLVSKIEKNLEVGENGEIIELKSDDGLSESSEWFYGTCSEDWWGEKHFFKKSFEHNGERIKLNKIKLKIDAKSSNNSDLYIDLSNEQNENLYLNGHSGRIVISKTELEVGNWIEKNIANYNIEFEGNELEINISEDLPENCSSVDSIHGTKISVDNNNWGNSTKCSLCSTYNSYVYWDESEIMGELMIRIEAQKDE
jgi:hypothetical protein